jgi:formylglycine-generating enzyme required for sulfatase activity
MRSENHILIIVLFLLAANCNNGDLTAARGLNLFGAQPEPSADITSQEVAPTNSPIDAQADRQTDTPTDSVETCMPACEGNEVCIESICQDIGSTWVPIPGGNFQMGCVPDDVNCNGNDMPQHPVTISAFDMLQTEVTEAQYFAVTGEDPSADEKGGGGDDSPVENVTWFDARAYCEAIGGRLPTEAEWEYAARAGGTTKYICGSEMSCLYDYAWYHANSDDGSGAHKHDVKGKLANDFGLFDMSGNVWEWVADWYDSGYYSASGDKNPKGPNVGAYRVRRGGSFLHGYGLRLSDRNDDVPSYVAYNLGFRCCRSVEP